MPGMAAEPTAGFLQDRGLGSWAPSNPVLLRLLSLSMWALPGQGRVKISPTWVPLQCSACLYILWGSKPKRRQWFMVPAKILAAQVAKAKRWVPQVPSHSLSARMLPGRSPQFVRHCGAAENRCGRQGKPMGSTTRTKETVVSYPNNNLHSQN